MVVPDAARERRLLRVFAGEALTPPPIWLMRQAGRYLPEYRAVRARAGDFLALCYSPELAAEVTLQPIRRFGFDAAILFADILLVPDALGQGVRFVEGEGPRLDAIRDEADLARLSLDATRPKFARVCETVARVREKLPGETALIGFCGAPWTVATYMVGGQGSADQADARLWAYRDPQGFRRLIDLLVEASVDYLAGQIEAGADLVQIFDTWAGSLSDEQFRRWVIAPTRQIVERLKARHPAVPVIGFARGAGALSAAYITATRIDGVGCDTSMSLELAARELAPRAVVQGNLDPLLLAAGGEALERRVADILAALAARPFIFNLGHGIVPQTPPEHVARLVELVRRGP
ncbi:MAG TPA: uroporphyrinogen decarboxylase [Hyphomicrobiaceae bacterium]|nr:uroporphyrinogen decarboxylase [Hyphomicrobiaceae bacterium]